MAKFTVSFVTPGGGETFSDVTQVSLPGLEGVIGVLAHHSMMTVGLKSGVVTIFPNKTHFFISGGLADINNNLLKIITDNFVLVSDLDPMIIKRELATCEQIFPGIEFDHERHVMQKKMDILQQQIDLIN